ncbi:MAG: XRE family transcriptional regulator [Gammaproteobacteria bacterium]|nr:XRE family transcriptional regulator [Gammaproteobacteria bacterium]MBU1440393.1 XRE family transcriptional regulator [Gammaproteobacteria bacterium]MBU2287421.1 XRE family transcriptional regulator [Gammaproteobacteria bacterium]MBU2409347.1 XRE family transcriptional regulator [Gammaproteobacteria bacterium]
MKPNDSTQPAPGAQRHPEPNTLDRETFGKRLHAARKQFGWTLAQLSELSGVSITTISRAERGQLALGYENFAALGHALQMDMNAMFAGSGVRPSRLDGPVVTRAGEGVVYRGLSFAYEFLGTTAAGKQMSPVVGTVHARRVNGPGDFARHAGEEFAYVLSGEIDVHFESGDVVRLARGDSLYFEGRIGHAYVSVSRQLAKIVGVTTSESPFMQSAREGKRQVQRAEKSSMKEVAKVPPKASAKRLPRSPAR